MAEATKKYAVVTGANKGIGLETVKQLTSKGIKVALTARDEKKGLEAVEKLKASGLFDPDLVVFHQLDVVDSTSIDSLAHFIKNQFGKLDILINNAGIIGAKWDLDALKASGFGEDGTDVDWSKIATQSYELSEECLKTNYYGTKLMCEAFIPLLQLSDSPRIVNVSSYASSLMNLPESAREVLMDNENLTEERVKEVLNKYLEDYKEGSIESKGWPSCMSAYMVSKAATNAYTRILAKRYPNMCINCVCPGFVKTDINFNTGTLSVEEGAESPVRLALLPHGGPSGLFFIRNEQSPF